MIHRTLFTTLVSVLMLAQAAIASPQATPAPSAQPSQQATAQPSPAQTAAPVHTMVPATKAATKPKIKKIPEGKLTLAQVLYGVAHPVQEAAKLKSMHQIRFENLRVYHVPAAVRARLHSHAFAGALAYESFRVNDALAQTGNPLLNILANINVQNALNNTLNGNSVGVTLSNVLNSNNIGIGQVLGVYIGGAGIITTIV